MRIYFGKKTEKNLFRAKDHLPLKPNFDALTVLVP